jgi:hypothetical protein
MKKSELTQLTQIIEHIVVKEIRKQLPKIMTEVFQNMMGKSIVNESHNSNKQEPIPSLEENPINFKTSLKELFSTPSLITKNQIETSEPKPLKQYTKNPIINQILNETTSDLRQKERLVGGAALQGGYSPAMALMAGFTPTSLTGPGQMMSSEEEPSFAKNMPSMPEPTSMVNPSILNENIDNNSAPLSSIPQGVSALDVAKQVPLASAVTQALTKNYSEMMKLIDKKRGKV